MIVKSEKLFLLNFVFFLHLFKVGSVSGFLKILWTTIITVSIFRNKWLNNDLLFFVNNRLRIIISSAVIAANFSFLNSNLNIIRQAQVDKWIYSSSVLFENLSFFSFSGEVCKNETVSACVSYSQHLQGYSIFQKLILISSVQHFFYFNIEWVAEFFLFSCILLNILEYLSHWENWNA